MQKMQWLEKKMKTKNENFLIKLLSQLESSKLILIIKGLLNDEICSQQTEQITISEEQREIPKTNEKLEEWYKEIQKETEYPYDSNVTIEKLSVSENTSSLSNNEEKLMQLLEKYAKPYLEPRKNKKDIKHFDPYLMGENQESSLNNLKKENDLIELRKQAEFRVDNNIQGKNLVESIMNDRVKNDRLAKELNENYKDQHFVTDSQYLNDLESNIKQIEKKNEEIKNIIPEKDLSNKELINN